MSFIESPRFPDGIAYGASGGPEFSTDVVISASGYEQRNQNWVQSRMMWEVSHGVKKQADHRDLIAFFRIVKGRAIGFRFKDFSDFQVEGTQGVLRQLTSTTWQMVKRYSLEGQTTDRDITKPVSGTVTVSGGGVYSINYTTGVVTKISGADPSSWVGEFDVPCRFDTDQMRSNISSYNTYDWNQIPIKEVRT